jgi:NAD-dependent histone deacetylase SIR2
VARSARPIRVGSLRPAIVLYDEPHPLGDDIGTIQSADVSRKPDMLIIMGTSLKVHGLKKLVKDFARTIHASNSPVTSSQRPFKVIFVNKTPPASEWADVIDYHIAAESDRWVTKVLEDWKKMRPADWEVQQTLVALDGNTSMSGGLKAIKTVKSSTEIKEKKGTSFFSPYHNQWLTCITFSSQESKPPRREYRTARSWHYRGSNCDFRQISAYPLIT